MMFERETKSTYDNPSKSPHLGSMDDATEFDPSHTPKKAVPDATDTPFERFMRYEDEEIPSKEGGDILLKDVVQGEKANQTRPEIERVIETLQARFPHLPVDINSPTFSSLAPDDPLYTEMRRMAVNKNATGGAEQKKLENILLRIAERHEV